MKVQIISFQCELKNLLGQVISNTYNRDVITWTPNAEQLALPGLAKGLVDVRPGEQRTISLKARDAYGLYDPNLSKEISLSELNGNANVGDQVHIQDANGKYLFYKVTQVRGDQVFVDANHALAGQDLVFKINVIEARDATEEEVRASGDSKTTQYFH